MKTIVLLDRNKNLYACHVDDADYEYVSQFKWSLHKQSKSEHMYAKRWIRDGENIKWIFMHNDLQHIMSNGMYVDHKNRNGLDNRRDNLRVVSQSLNILNSKPFKKKSDLPRGVTEVKSKGLVVGFKTCLRYEGIWFYLGFFKNVTLAYLAYHKKAIELGIYNYDTATTN